MPRLLSSILARTLLELVVVPMDLVPHAVGVQEDATPAAAGVPLTVVANGLTNPRGFTWGPDGTLYLALAGKGGETRIPVVEGFTAVIGLRRRS